MKIEEFEKIQLDNDYSFKIRRERLMRLRIILTVISGALAILIILIRSVWHRDILNSDFDYIYYSLTSPLIVIILFIIFVTMLLMIYLQTGFKKDSNSILRSEQQLNDFHKLENQLISRSAIYESEISNLQEKISHLSSKINNKSGIIDEKEKKSLITDLKSLIITETAKETLDEIKNQAEKKFSIEAPLKEIFEQFNFSIKRLGLEVAAQGRRGNLNLVLGIVTTALGLIFLSYFVLHITPNQTELKISEFISQFLPRLSVVLFIELFAYFFLQLYKSSLTEIKYFQNELTNVELKAIALRASLYIKNESVIAEAVKSLVNTERNKILEKEQTTIDLEKSKIEAKGISDIAKDLVEIVRKYKS